MNEKECPICNEYMEYTRIKDADAGEMLITVAGYYCPYCLCHELTIINISK
ncbi:hypothetical protein CLV62_12531 [Dysgonomonas alginatilytica]|uniref:Uncharacterized protein n=1 Tax=Dysgonomonas alginatilytica TaxID=1605892 RepID=A0A2V3PM76_9BACT|nr:hypothetical protein [Dysgonomonas alginatilytica]PXV61198.1 hypothetical protein CLV62_12531 [Dysgonomonas alginatilytica]